MITSYMLDIIEGNMFIQLFCSSDKLLQVTFHLDTVQG